MCLIMFEKFFFYLLDKIIPSILKVGPKEEAGPTVVSGVHRSSP